MSDLCEKSNFRVIVAGTRSFSDYELLKSKLDELLQYKKISNNIIIISGKASGADSLGEDYAKECGYPVEDFPADWKKFGKKAGYLRNIEMARVADACVVFWNGTSKGAEHMLEIAQDFNLILRVVKYKPTLQKFLES